MISLMIRALIKKYRKLMLSTMIVSALGCAIIIGISGTRKSLAKTMDRYVREYHYPDAVITTNVNNKDILDELNGCECIDSLVARMFADSTFERADGRIISVRAFSFRDDDFQPFYFWKKAQNYSGLDELYMEVGFAEDNGIKAGDIVKFRIGEDYREFFISALISMPETIVAQPTEETRVSNSDFGYVYGSEKILRNEVNQSNIDAKEELGRQMDKLEDAEKDAVKQYDYAEQSLKDAKDNLDTDKKTYETRKTERAERLKELEREKENIEKERKELADSKTALQNKRDSAGTQLAEYEKQLAELEETRKELKTQREELFNGSGSGSRTDTALLELRERQLIEDYARVKNGIDGVRVLISETEQGFLDIEESGKALDEKEAKYDEYIEKINKELEEDKEKLTSSETDIEENEKKLSDTWYDTRMRFADTRKEIEKMQNDLNKFKGYDYLCDQLLITFKEGYDHEESLKEVEALLKKNSGVSIKSSYTYEDSSVKQRIDINVQPIEQMSKFMPVVFFVVTLVVVFLFMSLMIKQSRRQIGIIRALGFTVGKVRIIFCIINLISSVTAVFVGTGIGMGVIRYSGGYFKRFFSLPFYDYLVEPSTVALAALFTIVTGQLATLMGTSVIGKILPSEAMSRPAPASSKMPKILQAATSLLSPLGKFCITSLLRNKARFAFSVICISSSVMMIFSAYAFITSKNQMLHEYYDMRAHYDSQIFFFFLPDRYLLNQLKLRDYLSDVNELYYYSCEISANGNSRSTLVNAMSPECELISIYDEQENLLKIPEKGIVLEKHLADELGVKKGDMVDVDGHELRISDISFQSFTRSQFISIEQSKELGDAKFWCVLCNIAKEDEQYLIKYLINRDDYVFNVFTSVLRSGDEKTFATYDAMAWIIIGFAVIIGLIIIINTTNTNLLEQKKELCVLRTLGFQHSELSRQWFVQSLLQFVFSCVIGLAAGGYLARLSLLNLSSDTREYTYANGIREYILTAVIVLSFIVVSHIVAMESLKKWDIVETVKEKE